MQALWLEDQTLQFRSDLPQPTMHSGQAPFEHAQTKGVLKILVHAESES
ncbi:MAG: hypothetical protein HC810_06625 [Acaryochloridaceae cyanobacterium RL_2_7]|nr:hypothetical protein [Acaryochloridaceae cyanobacterium RL_2_7]